MARTLFVVLLAFASLSQLALPRNAEAQHTGGSFGGSHFGGGGSRPSYGRGGGGSSPSFGLGGRTYRRSAPSAPSAGSAAGRDAPDREYHHIDYRYQLLSGSNSFALFFVGVACLFFIVVKVSGGSSSTLTKNPDRHREALATGALAPYAPLVDVSAIQLALDWRARPALQTRLDQLARDGDTSTPGGLARLLHETVVALRRAEASWLYAGAVNTLPSQPGQAERKFREIATEARTRFKLETVRVIDGRAFDAHAPALRARPEEGAGLVVVTLVVAATREIPDIARATDAHQLGALMRELGSLNARDIVGLEVIWSPATADDRLSSAELEALYPDLHRIDESTVVGRVFCGYCATPFPAEIQRCPSCGAPGTDAKRASA